MMALSGTRTFVGIGFGAIQAGLFLYEAFQAGTFRRLVAAEVLPDVVTSVRSAQGYFGINIAHHDHIESTSVGPIEICNPTQAYDLDQLIDAIAQAEEIATAVPSVAFYVSESPGSLHRLLAEGLRRKARLGGPRAVIYTAENHNHAAELLQAHVMGTVPAAEQAAVRSLVRFLNTVIGKMSGIIGGTEDTNTQTLAPLTPGSERAFLVEAFNRILISEIDFDEPFERGIRVFEEKPSLLPFEEAKLYGHNATHALAAYLGAVGGVTLIADLPKHPGMMPFLRAAFIEESGAALIRKHADIDPLFTPDGYAAYADDLLVRMTNPYLRDTVERVGRDPARKLGWNDRLIGTMRLALEQGIVPRRYALGAAAALAMLDRATFESGVSPATLLLPLWQDANPSHGELVALIPLIDDACQRLRRWQAAAFPDLETST
jgi:mannitol-1-phosphate 5-dehydrogenase